MDINKFNEMWISIFEESINVSKENFNLFLQYLLCFQIVDDIEDLFESESQREIVDHQIKKKSLRLFRVYFGGVLDVN